VTRNEKDEEKKNYTGTLTITVGDRAWQWRTDLYTNALEGESLDTDSDSEEKRKQKLYRAGEILIQVQAAHFGGHWKEKKVEEGKRTT